jgi:hypothetical protein
MPSRAASFSSPFHLPLFTRVILRYPISRDWNFVGKDPTSGTPTYLKGDLRVHPEIADFMRTLVGADKSPIRDLKIRNLPVGKKLLAASTGAKHLLL